MAEGVNSALNNPKLTVGVLTPPDKVNRFIMYSDKEASQNIKSAQYDVYVKTKKPRFEDRFSTPKSVFYAVGAAVLAVFIPSLKKLIKK